MNSLFEARAEEMGLEVKDNGCFFYRDSLGDIIYQKVLTSGRSIDNPVLRSTDNYSLPYMALFSSPAYDPNGRIGTRIMEYDQMVFCGLVSNRYQFVGHDVINEQIRESIREVGTPIFQEFINLNIMRTRMMNYMIIENSQNIRSVGDVFPIINVSNSYDGSSAVKVSFGINILEEGRSSYFTFRNSFSFGSLRQIHIQNSNTSMSTPIGNYIEIFNDNITNLIQENFNKQIEEREMFSLLDIIEEKVGKNRRREILNIINEVSTESNIYSAWNIFLSLIRFSSLESNLNAKILLENIAERVITIPVAMVEAMEHVNQQFSNT